MSDAFYESIGNTPYETLERNLNNKIVYHQTRFKTVEHIEEIKTVSIYQEDIISAC